MIQYIYCLLSIDILNIIFVGIIISPGHADSGTPLFFYHFLNSWGPACQPVLDY